VLKCPHVLHPEPLVRTVDV